MTIKNMQQAVTEMKRRFPTSYCSIENKVICYSNRETEKERRVYTDRYRLPEGYGVSGKAETWDRAFELLDCEIKTVTGE